MVNLTRGFEGGHGSHWDAAIEDPGQLNALVKETYRSGTLGAGEPRKLSAGVVRIRPRTLKLGDKGFEAHLLEVTPEGASKPSIATMFPHMATGGHPMKVEAHIINEWGNDGLEANIAVEILGGHGALNFFATDYWTQWPQYQQGKPLPISLSAVAYTLGIISPEERLEEVDGALVDVSRAAIIAPLKDNERAPYYDDDFFLQGPVVKVEPFAYPPWDEGAVVRIEVPGIGAIPVFGRKKNFPHGWPRLGEFVAAYAWLQGRVAAK